MSVFQHCIPQPAADILRVVGEGALKPDEEWLDAVYLAVSLVIPAEH